MLNIQIPTTLRIKIRRMIRQQPGYNAWRISKGGFKSRNISVADTLEAIEHFGLTQTVLDMIRNAGSIPVVGSTVSAPGSILCADDDDDAEADADDAADGTMMNTTEIDAETLGQIAMLGKVMADGERADADAEADALVASVLDPLRPFLSPTLLGNVSTALTPIAKRAVSPVQVEVERVVTVTVGADGVPVAPVEPVHPDAKRTGETTLHKLFGINTRNKHANRPVALWDCADAPAIDPFYVADASILAPFITCAEMGDYVWFAGPAGTGKSTTPEQYAARTFRPFVAISFQRAVEVFELIGSMGLDGKGGEVWRDGLLTRSIRRPGTVILLDEITSAPPGLLMVIQTLLSSRVLTLPTGERVPCADGVVIVAADNTRGYGDESGLYAGTMAMNAALVDRMAILIPVDYMAADLETQALSNRAVAPKPACRRVVDFINSARKLSGFETYPLSLRRMVSFVKMAMKGYDTETAFDLTCLTRLPTAEREALRSHYKAVFVESAFEAELRGQSAPVAPSNDPAQVMARDVFPDVTGA